MGDHISEAKRSLRREMLDVRRSIASGGDAGSRSISERSVAVRERLVQALAERFDGVPGAAGRGGGRVEGGRPRLRRLLAYDAVAGEVELGPLLDSMQSGGIEVVVPDATPDASHPVSPGWPDVVLVPGVAFDGAGRRLGRGGGWYDRFLGDVAGRVLVVGVAFEPQVVESVPTEAHDAPVDAVVTDRTIRWRPDDR